MTAKCLAGTLAVVLTGCAHEVGFNADYVSHALPESTTAGKLLIVMPQSEREFIYQGAAQSPRGAEHTLIIPMGAIVAEIGTAVFGQCFEQGVVFGNDLASSEGYALAVAPDLTSFVYRYTDFAQRAVAEGEDSAEALVLITPQVEVTLTVTAYDPAGRPVLEDAYESGTVSGESYIISNAPDEKINELLHATLHKLMMQAAGDVNSLLGGQCDLHELSALQAAP
ncbi:MAG TPA: hypothetical protein VJA26_06760 [Gammaproteobacteria bacterium]|nr:hypothetical protein [Gammaproteobacteria bacterium]